MGCNDFQAKEQTVHCYSFSSSSPAVFTCSGHRKQDLNREPTAKMQGITHGTRTLAAQMAEIRNALSAEISAKCASPWYGKAGIQTTQFDFAGAPAKGDIIDTVFPDKIDSHINSIYSKMTGGNAVTSGDAIQYTPELDKKVQNDMENEVVRGEIISCATPTTMQTAIRQMVKDCVCYSECNAYSNCTAHSTCACYSNYGCYYS